ncbi:hypothetical protein ACFFUO_00695 [Vibrio artabrorum]|uniref:Uncharacterized protein n=1 Tax=Vibrio artabrorum TaxID=446374 RepID=A0ABT8CFE5_9VIBR|nr:hypothetical protein [Vibrio artabrorum]MDN3700446.1 hypothetical protein [Vibrio artabrorum]
MQIYVPLLGNIIITINDKNLYEFSKRQFYAYLKSEEYTDNEGNDISFSFNLDSKYKQYFLSEEDISFSKNSNYKDNVFTIVKKYRAKNKKFQFYFDKDKYICNVNVSSVKAFEYVKFRAKGYSYLHNRFYEEVLSPIIATYSIHSDFFLTHSALITKDNRNIMLYGLDGVGKSTIVEHLVELGWNVEADNLVLFNGEMGIGLNLPIRVSRNCSVSKNMHVIFMDEKIKELGTIKANNEQQIVTEMYQLVMSDKIINRKINNCCLDVLIISNGAPEVNMMNSFISDFRLFSGSSSSSKINHNIKQHLLCNIKNNIEVTMKELVK